MIVVLIRSWSTSNAGKSADCADLARCVVAASGLPNLEIVPAAGTQHDTGAATDQKIKVMRAL